LLHDYKEDCNGNLDALPCSDTVKHAIDLLSFDKYWYRDHAGLQKEEALSIHYANLAKDRTATMVKLADRCNNVSTMAGVFTREKLVEYIAETRTHVLPLVRIAKEQWPELSEPLFIMKYHITSITDAIEATMQMPVV
jgi:GTP pyrophosphokinase